MAIVRDGSLFVMKVTIQCINGYLNRLSLPGFCECHKNVLRIPAIVKKQRLFSWCCRGNEKTEAEVQ